MPYFETLLNSLLTDLLDVRMCVDGKIWNENVSVEKIKVFVRN